MKFLAILGSPHGKKGNTAKLLEEVLAGVVEAGGEVEMISLAEKRVGPCLGCDACHKRGSCPIDDDFEEIKEKLLACDGFVLASPNYIFSVSAQMKALMDRCCGIIHCLALEGKYGAVVETSGGGGDAEVIKYMSRFVNSLGAVSVGGIGSAMAGPGTFPDQQALFANARNLGRELYFSAEEKRPYPEQDAPRQAFAARMKGLVDRMKDFWPYEYEYWQKVRG
ncbi:MAG: flavodoxin family protein [Desulfuromonadales bacterium]|jgi:multimeric flavodoxin WrbA